MSIVGKADETFKYPTGCLSCPVESVMWICYRETMVVVDLG